MKLFRFFGQLLRDISRGQFARAFFTFAMKLPGWLLSFNKAWIMSTEEFQFPEKQNPDVEVRSANKSDVADISRVGLMSRERVLELMDQGAECFIASLPEYGPLAVTWSAHGRVYVRGMGFEYDYGPHGYYTFFSMTSPEARGKGLYLRLQTVKVKHEISNGAQKFYGLVEFSNEYSRGLREKLGYTTVLWVTYIRLLGVRICRVKAAPGGESGWQIRLREPVGDVVIV